MKNTYEEFFYSEDPQEIERERKKKDSLLKLFPSLFSNPKDTTLYIPIKQDTTSGAVNNKTAVETNQTNKSQNFENNKKDFKFENLKDYTLNDITNFNLSKKLNKQNNVKVPYRDIRLDDSNKKQNQSIELENSPTFTVNRQSSIDDEYTKNKLNPVSYNEKVHHTINYTTKTDNTTKLKSTIYLRGASPKKDYSKQIKQLKLQLPEKALNILNNSKTEIKVFDNLHYTDKNNQPKKQIGIYTNNKIILDSNHINYYTLFSETVHAVQSFLGMTNSNDCKANLEFQEHVIKDLYFNQQLLKTGDINHANGLSTSSFNKEYAEFFKNIFDEHDILDLKIFISNINYFFDKFQKNYSQSDSYQEPKINNYDYKWIELLNIFGIQYK